MKAELINPFIDSTMNVLSTMAQVKPVPGKPYLKQDNRSWGVVTGIIGLAGAEMVGNMMVSFEEKCILHIVSQMLMEKYTEVNDEVIDAVGEITNMITGGVKKGLLDHGLKFDLAIPVMIKGENVELTQLTKAPIIVVPFDTEQGKFVVEANLAPRAG